MYNQLTTETFEKGAKSGLLALIIFSVIGSVYTNPHIVLLSGVTTIITYVSLFSYLRPDIKAHSMVDLSTSIIISVIAITGLVYYGSLSTTIALSAYWLVLGSTYLLQKNVDIEKKNKMLDV